MNFTDQELLTLVPQGDVRAVARLITLLENKVPRARAIQSQLFSRTGRAHVVGVTGSPGAGKSTLVDQLAKRWRAAGKKVAILAIDPSSPFSGGAVLGDRIRMVGAAEIQDIFIRSMATRGSLGGISAATIDAVQVLDAAGFDLILVETVGVGQAEVDIIRTADTCLVVLVPGMGDSVQAIKAGILEIADLFVINKADREGADLLQKDLRILLSLAEYKEIDWEPPIVRTIATSGDGVDELLERCLKHQEWLRTTGKGEHRRFTIVRENIIKLAVEITQQRVLNSADSKLDKFARDCLARTIDPYTAAQQLLGL